MRTNRLKRDLVARKPTFGSWVSLSDLWSTRVLARVGFDWLTVDLEHAPIGWGEAAAAFASIADNGCIPLARVPAGNHDHIKRALDSGAWGIVVPMVDTATEARAVVAAAKYPPVGIRSTGGGLHAMSFGTTAADYYTYANEEVVVVVQIESPRGIANLPEICAVPGVDAVFVGPSDLRSFMRTADRHPTNEEFEAAIEQVERTATDAGVATGIYTFDAQIAARRADQGITMIGVSSDILLMSRAADEAVAQLRAARPDWQPSDDRPA